MALTVGSSLAHYDVTALIGEGGMGQPGKGCLSRCRAVHTLRLAPDGQRS